jgi:hypothetical protein
MKQIHKELIKLLSSAIRNNSIDNINYCDKELDGIFQEAIAHDVYQLIYPMLLKSNMSKSKDLQDTFQAWKSRTFISGLRQKRCLASSIKVIDELQKNKIDVVILKGLALRYYYPNPDMRSMGDIDLFVRKTDIDRTISILIAMGYEVDDSDSKHICLTHPEQLNVELHWELVNTENYKKDVTRINEQVWSNLEYIDFGNVKARTLNINLQTVYVCLHMANHMLSSGFGLRPVCDLVLLVEKRKSDIDWKLVRNTIIDLGIDDFVSTLLVICNKFLDLELIDVIKTEVLNKTHEENSTELLKDILESGNHGNRTVSRTESRVLLKKNKDDISLSPGNIFKYFSMLFPKAGEKYKYIRKLPFLIPIAVIYYLISDLISGNFRVANRLTYFIQTTNTSHKRSKLLKSLNLR